MSYWTVPDFLIATCPGCKKRLKIPNFRYTWERCQFCQFPFLQFWVIPAFKETWTNNNSGIPNPTGCQFCHGVVPFGANSCFHCSHDLWEDSRRWPREAMEHLIAHPDQWRTMKFPINVDELLVKFTNRLHPKPTPIPSIPQPGMIQTKPSTIAIEANWRGSWQSNLQYSAGDRVFYSGNIYQCLSPNGGRTPFGSPMWDRVT